MSENSGNTEPGATAPPRSSAFAPYRDGRNGPGNGAPSHRLRIAIPALVLLLGGAFAVRLLWARRAAFGAAEAATRTSDVAKGNRVRLVAVTESPAVRHVDLLGEARPDQSVTLYAKVAGYLKTVRVDVGSRVAAGDVLATIESPETDRALLAAKADYDNKRVTADRVATLLQRKLVSAQEADQARTDAAVAEQRLEAFKEQQGYETLRAPFGGRVTARFADPGALAQSAATSQTSALPVVTVSKIDTLRIFVYLDQSDAASTHAGTPVTVTTDEHRDVHVVARISRVSGELDPKTRKMLAEVDIENRDGSVVAGSFVPVRVDLPDTPKAQAPAEALLVRGTQTFVGTVDDQSRVHLKPVTVASNDGKIVTFGSGVAAGERIALSLESSTADGDHVEVAPDSARDSAAAKKPAPASGGSR
jgi:membrane fusion protein, multidrug efflux system